MSSLGSLRYSIRANPLDPIFDIVMRGGPSDRMSAYFPRTPSRSRDNHGAIPKGCLSL